jgi:hypothetical protein
VKDSAVGGFVYKLWRVCTTTLEGSLSDTFKLVSSDDSDEARTSASGVSKLAAKVGDADSFLDAVVVDNEDHVEVKGPGLHQSDSSQRSGQGGSNSTGLGMHRLDFHGDDGHHYQGGLKSWIICVCIALSNASHSHSHDLRSGLARSCSVLRAPAPRA